MYKVKHYRTKEEFTVYGVSETMQKAPMFLLHIDGEFVWKMANDYIPC
jgi:hypothetical protein